MRAAWLGLCMWFVVLTAQAQQLEVECVERQECELDMLAACPEGAVIVGERLQTAQGAPEAGYTRAISYTCGNTVRSTAEPSAQEGHRAMIDAREQARPGQIRLLQTQRSKVRIVGPVILTLIASGLTGTALTFAMLADESGKRNGFLTVSVFPAALLLLPGAIWLRKSVQERRELQQQIDSLSVSQHRLVPTLSASRSELRVGVALSF